MEATAGTTEATTSMSYERDPDILTRGVGAIAASDHSLARYRRRVQVARATQRRDQAMSAIAMGALGRINLVTQREPGGGGLPTTPRPPVVNTPPIAPLPPPTGPLSPVIVTSYPTSSPLETPPIFTPLPPVLSPILTAPSSKPPTTGGGMSTGSGTVGVTGGAGPVTTFEPIPDLPDDSAYPTAHSNTGKLLLIGGGLLALWWLLARDDRKGAS